MKPGQQAVYQGRDVKILETKWGLAYIRDGKKHHWVALNLLSPPSLNETRPRES